MGQRLEGCRAADRLAVGGVWLRRAHSALSLGQQHPEPGSCERRPEVLQVVVGRPKTPKKRLVAEEQWDEGHEGVQGYGDFR